MSRPDRPRARIRQRLVRADLGTKEKTMNGKHRWMLATREMAGRLQGIRVLRSYLDGGSGEVTTRRVARNLRACRRGGLEAAVYREIKASLARHAPAADPGAADRPRTWGAALASGTTGGGSAISAGELR